MYGLFNNKGQRVKDNKLQYTTDENNSFNTYVNQNYSTLNNKMYKDNKTNEFLTITEIKEIYKRLNPIPKQLTQEEIRENEILNLYNLYIEENYTQNEYDNSR